MIKWMHRQFIALTFTFPPPLINPRHITGISCSMHFDLALYPNSTKLTATIRWQLVSKIPEFCKIQTTTNSKYYNGSTKNWYCTYIHHAKTSNFHTDQCTDELC